MFETIMTISGKPGLYRMLSRGNNMFIVETIDATHKRIPVYNSDKIVLLDDIAIYTDTEEIPLRKVFQLIYEKAAGALPFNIKETTPEDMKEYFESVLPDYDKEIVYITHINKIYSWYNILVANEITDFKEEETEEVEAKEEE
ncbi:MAG: DUF5606 domain-containing protein [Bacteroidaceae bacterium]|nr:DUF5606 domain-containing protein [Bacteroidaceae bacterium]